MKKEKINKLCLEKFISYNLHCGNLQTNKNSMLNPYLQGIRNGFCIYDLRETRFSLCQSLKFLKKLLLEGKKILFIGCPQGMERKFLSLSFKNGHYVTRNWSYGLFTNLKGTGSSTGKPFSYLKERPSLLFIFDLSLYQEAKKEASRLDIPLMAFVNTDESLENIDYYVPANIKSWKGGAFAYNLFFHLFRIYKRKTVFSQKKKKRSNSSKKN